ncbi:MAG TPA: prepilin-type N-terminal cleavage/methylation domain-containing protein [Candidatus Acidoferrales bacterium]|nr:prepilin-type N-terminal cleavage/methylation domain-containing protein [Candidatus Acidoferrales bacterium]
MKLPKQNIGRATGRIRPGGGGFTLLEVMVAIAIFFIGSCAILDLVSSSLNNVRRLQRPSVDAGPVLARYAATNSLVEGTYQGSLGDPELLGQDYRDYNYIVTITEVRSNHLYSVECAILPAHGKPGVISDLSTVLYRPQSPKGSLDGGPGMTGH